MARPDPVLSRIHAHPWPRGAVHARRAGRGYTLYSARTAAPMARLRPIGSGDEFEVLWWRRDAWGPVGFFGESLPLDEALDFIAQEPCFWIRA